jgi:hypothetical protein
MHEICNFIDNETKNFERGIENGGRPSFEEAKWIDLLQHMKKSMLTNKAMEDNYSEARARTYGMGRSFENNGVRGNDGMSYDRMSYDSNRNRDSMGRYSRDAFMDKLMEMRMSAPNDKAKRAVDKMIDELEN